MKVLKVLGAALAAVATAAIAFAAFVSIRGIPHYATERVELSVEVTPERVARGRKWASLLCAECHRDSKTGLLTGSDMRLDDEFGNVHSYNITQHPTMGIGSWTDGEIAYLLRTGVARDGRYTPPWMTKLPHLSDEDLNSIIAFLRSDDAMVHPSAVASIPSKPNFFSKFLATVAFKPYPFPRAAIVAPSPSDAVAYGKYLTWNLDCWTCHSPDFSTINPLAPDTTPGYLSGGNRGIKGHDDRVVVTANLTPDPETGLGKWSEADFVKAVREGVRPDGTPIRMNSLGLLTDEEAKAIWAYLKTVPAIRNPVPRTPLVLPPPDANSGQKVYYAYACVSCHAPAGNGVCDLTHNKEHYPSDDALKAFIENPRTAVPDTIMPSWGGVIPSEQMRDLISFVRGLDRTPANTAPALGSDSPTPTVTPTPTPSPTVVPSVDP